MMEQIFMAVATIVVFLLGVSGFLVFTAIAIDIIGIDAIEIVEKLGKWRKR